MNALLRSIAAILGGRFARLLVMLFFTPVVVRLLSQEEYGLYAYLMAVIGIVTVVVPLGLFDAVRKHVAEYSAGTTEEGQIAVVALLLSGIYALLGAVTLVVVNNTFEIVPSPFATLVIGIILGNNLFQVCRGVFYGRQRERVPEVVATVRQACFVVAGLGAAYYGFGVVGILAAYTLVLVLITGWFLAQVIRTVEPAIELRQAVTERGPTIRRYGLVQASGGIAAVLLYKTDILLVDYFRGSAETALYQAALLPAEYVWFVPSAIQMALLQNTAHHWARDETDQINDNVRDGLLYAALALVLFGGGLFVLAEELVTVYFGPTYQQSALPLRILLLGTVFFGLNRILVPVLQATGWLRYTEALTVAALVLNVVLNVVLIPRFGIRGAAVGTASSYVFVFLGGLALWHRSEFVFLSGQELARLGGMAAAFGGVFWLFVRTASLPPLVALVIFPSIGFALFLVLSLSVGLVTVEELRTVKRAIIRELR